MNFPQHCAAWERLRARVPWQTAPHVRLLHGSPRSRNAMPTPPLTVLMQIWDRPIYTVSAEHLMSDALRLCGARNLFADLHDVAAPAVELEAVMARDPDMIIAASPPGAAAAWLTDWKKFTAMQAVRSGRLIGFEDQRLSGLGPSALTATASLCEVIAAKRTAP